MKKIESIDYWFYMMVKQKDYRKDIYKHLKNDLPYTVSLLAERKCIFKCEHCILPWNEKSTGKISTKFADKFSKFMALYKEKIPNVHFVHQGKIFLESHRKIFKMMKKLNISISMISNGQINEFSFTKNYFDFIDISVDGLKQVHQRQRPKIQDSFEYAIKALKYSSEISRSVTSLFTATKINFFEYAKTASFLEENNLVNEHHCSPIIPGRDELKKIDLNFQEFEVFFNDFKSYSKKSNLPMYMRLYELRYLEYFKKIIGNDFSKIFKNAEVSRGEIYLNIGNNAQIIYIPESLQVTGETFMVDGLGMYRLPHAIRYGVNDKNITVHTIDSFYDKDPEFLFEKGVESWWKLSGEKSLEKELVFFRRNLL